MSFIPYNYDDSQIKLTDDAIRDIFKNGDVHGIDYMVYRYEQVGRRPNMEPEIKILEMTFRNKLKGWFQFTEEGGISREYTSLPVMAQSRRHEGAYIVSEKFGLRQVPVVVRRKFGEHLGYITGDIKGGPVFKRNSGFCDFVPGLRAYSVAESLIFNYIIGSGNYLLSSLVADDMGRVYSRLHQQAFSYGDNDIIEWVFAKSPRKVSQGFWQRMTLALGDPFLMTEIQLEIAHLVGEPQAKSFVATMREVMRSRHLGNHPIILP